VWARLIISPDRTYAEYKKEAQKVRIVRLGCLVDFLEEAKTQHLSIKIAQVPSSPIGESTTIVGDWFFSESISGTAHDGYRQTIFTCHAATIGNKIQAFDEMFSHAEKSYPWPGTGSSHERAIAYLKQLIYELKAQPPTETE
jgi:hypothetical protein